MDHPLDRPIWTALTTRQADLAQESGGVRRYDPEVAPFAASAEGTTESLAALADLVPHGGQIYLQQAESISPPSGFKLLRAVSTVQMVAKEVAEPANNFAMEELADVDAPEMLSLALLTKPGPFARRTHELGKFLGVRRDGRLIAMAGERMKAGAFTEVSGVCTHPDHRGKGYAADLMRAVSRNMLARGETPFLHAFADNAGAIALYERLGFVIRWRPILMAMERV